MMGVALADTHGAADLLGNDHAAEVVDPAHDSGCLHILKTPLLCFAFRQPYFLQIPVVYADRAACGHCQFFGAAILTPNFMGAIIKLEIKRAVFIRFRTWPYAGDGADDAQALQDEEEDAVRLAHVVGMLVEQRAHDHRDAQIGQRDADVGRDGDGAAGDCLRDAGLLHGRPHDALGVQHDEGNGHGQHGADRDNARRRRAHARRSELRGIHTAGFPISPGHHRPVRQPPVRRAVSGEHVAVRSAHSGREHAHVLRVGARQDRAPARGDLPRAGNV